MSVKKMRRVSRARLYFLNLQAANPEAVFGQLLSVIATKGYKFGFAIFKFEQIFGYRPKFNKRIEAVPPSSNLLSWLASERRNYGSRMKRLDEKQAKANELPLRRLEAIVGEIEAIVGEIEALTASLRAAGIDCTHSADAEAYAIVDRIERSMVEHGAKGYIQMQEAAE